MPDANGNPTVLDYIIRAAGHELMGETSLVAASATGGSSSTLVDTNNLLTFGNDDTYSHRWLYLWSGSNAGQDRFVSNFNGSNGTLQFGSSLSNSIVAGDEYLLFRDFRFRDWVDMANETLRNLYYPLQFYLQGQSNIAMYTLPTPLSNGKWIIEVRRGPYPFQFTNSRDRHIRWYRIEPRFMSVAQQVYLALEETLSTTEQLLFECQVPYSHPHMSMFTNTRSVVTPFGESVVLSPPMDLVVLGIVWRALVRKEKSITGTARKIWTENRKNAAIRYGEACAGNGVVKIGMQLMWANEW